MAGVAGFEPATVGLEGGNHHLCNQALRASKPVKTVVYVYLCFYKFAYAIMLCTYIALTGSNYARHAYREDSHFR